MVSNYYEPCLEQGLSTIEEETDENISILVESLNLSFNGAVRSHENVTEPRQDNQNTTNSNNNNSSNEAHVSLNLCADQKLVLTNEFETKKLWSYERWALMIGISITAVVILIGLFVGLILWLTFYLNFDTQSEMKHV